MGCVRWTLDVEHDGFAAPVPQAEIRRKSLAPRGFSTGPVVLLVPCRVRSKSFSGQGNSYRVEKLPGVCFEWFADGISDALTMPDEVARNGAL